MLNHSLTFLALLPFSIVSNAAAIPMDADQVVMDATQNAVLHKEVAVVQGGDSDRDVAETVTGAAKNSCPADAICSDTDTSIMEANPPAVSDWFVVQDSSSRLQPLAVLLLIIGLIMFFLSRKSISTK